MTMDMNWCYVLVVNHLTCLGGIPRYDCGHELVLGREEFFCVSLGLKLLGMCPTGKGRGKVAIGAKVTWSVHCCAKCKEISFFI